MTDNRTPVVPPRKVAELRNDPYAGQSGDLSVNNALRAFSRGAVYVGPYTDELTAGTDAVLAPYVDPLLPDRFRTPGRTLGERYDNALAVERGKNLAFDEQHPYISEALQLAGEAASTAALKGANPRYGKFLKGAIEGFGEGEGGFENRVEQAIRNAIKEALPEFGMMRAEAGTEGDPRAGGKAALTRALLRVRGGNGGGGW